MVAGTKLDERGNSERRESAEARHLLSSSPQLEHSSQSIAQNDGSAILKTDDIARIQATTSTVEYLPILD
jgi:hypothetical protein